jgi:hypothetical protein
MAATIADFVVRQGIVVQATNEVTSSTAQTAALQVNSGAAIAKNLIVGTTATVWGPLTVYGPSTLANINSAGIVTLTNSSNASSPTTGALQVTGGVGVGSDLFVGGVIYGSVVGLITTATNLASGTDGSIPYQITPGRTSFIGTGTTGSLLQMGATTATFVTTANIYVNSSVFAEDLRGGSAGNLVYQSAGNTTAFVTNGTAGQVLVSAGTGMPLWQNTLTLAGTTQATSTNTGALQVAGGVGIGGNLIVGGEIVAQKLTIQLTTVTTTSVETDDIIKTSNTTQATSTTTGALTVAGGAGIGGNLFVGGTINVAGGITGTATTATNLAGGSLGTIPFQTAPGVTSFIGTGTAGSILQMGANTATFVTTASVYVNSSVFAEDLRGGTAGQLVYQSAPNVTAFAGPGTAGQLLVSAGTAAPVYTNTGSIYVGAATSSVNLFGGAGGSLPYQTSAGVTTFLGIGTNGFVLTSNGTAPTWASLAGLSAGLATTATNLAAGTAGQVPYQIAPGQTGFYGPGTAGQVLVSGGTGAPVYQSTLTLSGTTGVFSTNSGALQVAGGVGIGGGLFVGNRVTATNIVNITDTTAATSTTTGALTVAGGVGIGGTIHVGPVAAGTTVPAVYSNNVLLASYTSPVLTQGVQANLDTFAVSAYTSAKYFVQMRQQSSTNVHITEISLFHDGTTVYLNEYATAWNGAVLGTFDSNISGGNVILQITPNAAVTVKVVRLSLTA